MVNVIDLPFVMYYEGGYKITPSMVLFLAHLNGFQRPFCYVLETGSDTFFETGLTVLLILTLLC